MQGQIRKKPSNIYDPFASHSENALRFQRENARSVRRIAEVERDQLHGLLVGAAAAPLPAPRGLRRRPHST